MSEHAVSDVAAADPAAQAPATGMGAPHRGLASRLVNRLGGGV
ncbi:MAG: hypothetical protein QOE54_5340, partial [Streptosporangiaceae bacterium]|nr:hypothetical protein [Streptosporangiaceae bacterium]